MLPPGHIAAGFLAAKVLLHYSHQNFTSHQITQLLWWGAFFGFSPDLDVFYFFIRNKTLLVAGKESSNDSHRSYISHAPILWLVAGLLIYFLAATPYVKFIGLLLWLGSWSHFLLDSIEYGIMWLWPLSNRIYALKNREVKAVVEEKGFVAHIWGFLKLYSVRVTFYVEILILGLAIYILAHSF